VAASLKSGEYPMQIVAIIHKSVGTYGVSFPDLPGCIAAGTTEQEALTNAAAAVAFHIEHMSDHGDVLPMPRALDQLRADPEFAADFDGHVAVALVPYTPPGKTVRINITIDEHLLAAIDRAAKDSGSTRSGLLAEAARRKIIGQ
jgi:predicted RNase H-like HicB family nuclease